MLSGIIIPFITIIGAELFDKSQLSILLLATKTKRVLPLLAGVMLAFLLVDGLSILLGAWIATVVPPLYLKLVSGGLFIFFGIRALMSHEEDTPKAATKSNIFMSAFLLVFGSEWGDKTQLASGIFATQYPPLFVLIGVLAALFLLSIVAVYAAKALTKFVNPQLIHRIAGVVFILLGLFFLFS